MHVAGARKDLAYWFTQDGEFRLAPRVNRSLRWIGIYTNNCRITDLEIWPSHWVFPDAACVLKNREGSVDLLDPKLVHDFHYFVVTMSDLGFERLGFGPC